MPEQLEIQKSSFEMTPRPPQKMHYLDKSYNKQCQVEDHKWWMLASAVVTKGTV